MSTRVPGQYRVPTFLRGRSPPDLTMVSASAIARGATTTMQQPLSDRGLQLHLSSTTSTPTNAGRPGRRSRRGPTAPNHDPTGSSPTDAAVDTELGVLKTGKEADVFLIDRSVPGDPTRTSLLAAKRYRSTEHRQFHRDAGYTEGRRNAASRDNRALAKKSAWGKQVASGAWAHAEFSSLTMLWSAGVPVPYPVMIDGSEILMEFI